MSVHRIVDHQLSLALPRHWPTRERPAPGIVLEARSPVVPASGFAPALVVRTVPLDDLPAPPAGVEVEDDDEFELGGRRVGYERLGHAVGATEVVTDQWTWIVGDTAVVVAGTVSRADYADYCDVFEDVAATVVLTPTGAGGPGSVRLAGARW
ncbi:hypothetical protein CFH99_21405 [Nocardioides aromaticivorans]|uniref:Uncharacterized protein n=1 Tax=Nocardioides aromaticivorans TaxID=200618 RepID=A0ABX7PQX5_9ACTN|nr:hypothetical protein [Nocardioides aromaticivorans]QSR28183.1 hypothetical protein CFH99_21405 [Nocardioides aromaticivorans]